VSDSKPLRRDAVKRNALVGCAVAVFAGAMALGAISMVSAVDAQAPIDYT
jgi:hypothetical protein